jgi:hypothetical protein
VVPILNIVYCLGPSSLLRGTLLLHLRHQVVGDVRHFLGGAQEIHVLGFVASRQISGCPLQGQFRVVERLPEDPFVTETHVSQRDLDHPSVVAWNLFTGLYFKIDGLPWGPTGLPPGTCFIGISFFRPLGESSTLRTSVVQAFDENGEGLVLRGHRFNWDERRQGRSALHHAAGVVEVGIEDAGRASGESAGHRAGGCRLRR